MGVLTAAEQRRQDALRQRARNLFWVEDQLMLAKARRALRRHQTRDLTERFELTGDTSLGSA